MKRKRRSLGSSGGEHRSEAELAAMRTRGALMAARGAFERGDCANGWAAISHAAENLGSLAAHADSGGARRAKGNIVPADDEWGQLKARLHDVMKRGGKCFRR